MVIDWINNKFQTAFSNAELESIKDFSLIWNVFERYVCANYFTIARAEAALRLQNFNLNDFDAHLAYFKNRYIQNGQVNNRFANLNFRRNDREDFVKDVLLGTITSEHEVILALTIIVSRFRNNLFHGIKEIQLIDRQNENFHIANSFLTKLMDYY